jgi:predicted transposase YdaD
MFTLGDLKQTRVYQDAYREALQVGETRGREEGKQEGRREGELRTILRILDRKFGTLPPQLVSQISALPIERLDDLADAVLDLQNLDELVRWLS